MTELDSLVRLEETKDGTVKLWIIGSGNPSDDQPYDQDVELGAFAAEDLADRLLAMVGADIHPTLRARLEKVRDELSFGVRYGHTDTSCRDALSMLEEILEGK